MFYSNKHSLYTIGIIDVLPIYLYNRIFIYVLNSSWGYLAVTYVILAADNSVTIIFKPSRRSEILSIL